MRNLAKELSTISKNVMPLVSACVSKSPSPVFTNKPTATLQQSATHGDMFPALCRSFLKVLGHHVQTRKQTMCKRASKAFSARLIGEVAARHGLPSGARHACSATHMS